MGHTSTAAEVRGLMPVDGCTANTGEIKARNYCSHEESLTNRIFDAPGHFFDLFMR